MTDRFEIRKGLSKGHRGEAVELYWEAFGPKLNRLMRPEAKALDFLRDVVTPSHALSAVAADGSLLGVAGFKTAEGAFIGGRFADLARHYGWIGAAWRGPLLDLLERDLEADTLLMDGICVAQHARGAGVGSALLDAVCDEALSRDLACVRLDVIDENPRAKALYLRKGFVEAGTTHLGPLRFLFGFRAATTMVRALDRE